MFGIIVMTDYQLLNALKFVNFNNEGSLKNSDLYVCSTILNYEEKIKKVSEAGVFCNVYGMSVESFSSNGVKRKINSSILYFRKNAFLDFIIGQKKKELIKKKNSYETLIMGCINLQCQMFLNYFNYRRIYFIEDGLGSYFGNVYTNNIGKSRYLINRLLHKNTDAMKLYVNCPDICNIDMKSVVCKIQGIIDENYKSLLKTIYGNSHKIYYPEDMVYLRQPLKDFGEAFEEKDLELISMLNNHIGSKLIIREHPRNTDRASVLQYRTDQERDMWEYVCIDQISSQNTLIGMFSTAQITPKILFDSEPYIVFLVKLYPLKDELLKRQLSLIEKIKKIYDEEKIFVPENIEELKGIIVSIYEK